VGICSHCRCIICINPTLCVCDALSRCTALIIKTIGVCVEHEYEFQLDSTVNLPLDLNWIVLQTQSIAVVRLSIRMFTFWAQRRAISIYLSLDFFWATTNCNKQRKSFCSFPVRMSALTEFCLCSVYANWQQIEWKWLCLHSVLLFPPRFVSHRPLTSDKLPNSMSN